MIMESTLRVSKDSKNVADILLNLGAVQLNTEQLFTWVSGIQSPIYCDNRKINSDVLGRKVIVNAFVDLIQEQFKDVEIIAGVATGGIPMGVLIADRMNLPFIYVRQAPKEHGLMKQVEGAYKQGSKVVLIEDHISTGGSSLKAIEGLRNEKLDVLSLISIMTYGFSEASSLFERNKITQWSLCDLDSIVSVALERGLINTSQKMKILAFRDSH